MAKKRHFTDESFRTFVEQIKEYINTIASKLSTDKANKDHNHDDVYETKTDAVAKLAEAKQYTDDIAVTKADLNHNHDDIYFTKTEIENMELITVADIDEICGSTILFLR